MYEYTIGDEIDLKFMVNNKCQLSRGWSFVENDGVWSDGKESQICLYLHNNIDKETNFKFKVQYLAPDISGKVEINTNSKDKQFLVLSNKKEYNFKIKKNTLNKGYNFISFTGLKHMFQER